jgi:hypothetical protein
MKRKLLVLLILAIPALASAQHTLVTGNQYVWAEVIDTSGWIWFGAGAVADHTLGDSTGELSAQGQSYLSVMINDTIFDNTMPSPSWLFIPPQYLSDGKTSMIADTIQTIWQGNGFDILQNVYPVEFGISGTIVLSIEVINHRASPIVAQAQYLLHDEISGIDESENGARSLVRYPRGVYGFGGDATVDMSYPNNWGAGYPVPPFFMTFLHTDSQKTYLSDDVGVCYLSDSSAPVPLGLINPSLLVLTTPYGGWGIQTLVSGDYTTLVQAQEIQWPPDTIGGVGKDSVSLIGRTCYGTGDYDVCSGDITTPTRFSYPLTTITLYPHLIHTVDGKPVPNTFTVESVIVGDTSQKGSATLSVTGKQSIIAPMPFTNGGTSQNQAMVSTTHIGSDLMDVQWTDSVFANRNGPIALSLTIDDSVSSNPPHEVQTCGLSTSVDGIIYPTPIGTVISRTGSYDGSVCNTRCTEVVAYDTGNVRIPVLSVTADSLTNMRLSIAPNHVGADSTFYTVCVIDSMLNGNAVITLTDTAGDTGIERYEYCTIPDTTPPLIQELVCFDSGAGICLWEVSDTQAWDRGLDTLYFTNVMNEEIDSVGSVHGLGFVVFQVTNGLIPFGFCITAIDLAGNKIDTCFGIGGNESVLPAVSLPFDLSVYPNPSSGDVNIFLSSAPSADVEIFDVLGREVDHFQVNGSYDWETGGLPAGTYIIRANENGPGNSQPITKRIVKQ